VNRIIEVLPSFITEFMNSSEKTIISGTCLMARTCFMCSTVNSWLLLASSKGSVVKNLKS